MPDDNTLTPDEILAYQFAMLAWMEFTAQTRATIEAMRAGSLTAADVVRSLDARLEALTGQPSILTPTAPGGTPANPKE